MYYTSINTSSDVSNWKDFKELCLSNLPKGASLADREEIEDRLEGR